MYNIIQINVSERKKVQKKISKNDGDSKKARKLKR